MKRSRRDQITMAVDGIEVVSGAGAGAYDAVTIATDRGRIDCRYYPAAGARSGVVWVGGVGGGFDTPAGELYPVLSGELMAEGIASLRIQFRHSTVLQEAVLDVMAGLSFLEDEGIETLAVVGHSFGGAVVIHAASQDDHVRTVVTLASQSYGAEPAARLAPRCSLLLIHGTSDETLPASSSQQIYHLAREPKELVLLPGASHGLSEVSDKVHDLIRDWLIERLKPRDQA